MIKLPTRQHSYNTVTIAL